MNSEAKGEQVTHTPGPWILDYTYQALIPPGTKIAAIVNGDGPKTICSLMKPFIRLNLEERANGRLIAAAPDLLAACKAVLPGLESAIAWAVGVEIDEIKAKNPLVAQVRNAIAKAEGD